MAAERLSIGLLARDRLQQRTLRALVEQSGHRVADSLLFSELLDDAVPQQRNMASATDAWIVAAESVDNEMEPAWLEGLDWMASLQGSVIFCDGPVPGVYEADYSGWERRLKAKLNELAGTISLSQSAQGSAQQVWVLAASTGGPAAVKEFLAELPRDLGLGFIYVQHIDAGYENTLIQAFSRGNYYPAYQVTHGCVVRSNALAIIPANRMTELLPNGTFLVGDKAWAGSYNPSIDCVLANVAHSYGERSGVIVFTGMGNDGAMSSRLMRKSGGKVWVQTPDSSTVDSMPLATLATGCVEFEGTPAALAQKLTQTFHQKTKGSASSQVPEAKTIGVRHE